MRNQGQAPPFPVERRYPRRSKLYIYTTRNPPPTNLKLFFNYFKKRKRYLEKGLEEKRHKPLGPTNLKLFFNYFKKRKRYLEKGLEEKRHKPLGPTYSINKSINSYLVPLIQ